MIWLPVTGLFIICVVLPMWARRGEIKRWNNGVCPQTGEQWEYFDTDSQGGRGYKSGKYGVWISYPSVDKATRE